MEVREIQEKLEAAPYFSKENVSADVYEGLSKMRALLCERGEDDPHLLNKSNVLALWYFTEMTFDGQPQIIIRLNNQQAATRMSLQLPQSRQQDAADQKQQGEYEMLLLDKEIFDLIQHDVAFDYDEDIIKGSTVIAGEQDELFREILEGRVVMVFNKERDDV